MIKGMRFLGKKNKYTKVGCFLYKILVKLIKQSKIEKGG